MEGYEAVDSLMIPVLAAIKRHVKEGDAITDIYNRAYEALMKAIDGKVWNEVPELTPPPAPPRGGGEGGVMEDISREDATLATAASAGEGEPAYGFVPADNNELEQEQENDALKARIAELEAANRWIPVSERLPDCEGQEYQENENVALREDFWCEYLWKTPFQTDQYIGVLSYNYDKERWEIFIDDDPEYEDITVIQWHRLPEPPESEE